ncbi:NERD domain-containing protein [Brevibacillus laterosporus]|uniref:HRDC domain-containing protein n=1 Tax=Brevibacillus laterosporus TaxID=1465 RepID=UPI00037502E9|nr:HRDC domain-containing protein [Brevibacillus laterosporus]ATO51051.1 aldolase [Brevibacillus laterosporus DSM 25]MBG9788675.1 aldolase [Brevibacillus laterosporus]MED2004325.1 NERD domain-containing protein [Brevibacillus laterosporus]
MSIFNKLFGQKRTIQSPTFVKDFSKDNHHLSALNDLLNKVVDGERKDNIERDIRFLTYGLDGENNVYFELKNSFQPILCLHDVRVVYEDYVAQLDFVVISNKFICILETKKLSGNISIDQDGNFVRIMKNKYGKEYKMGIYSPITQNTRHIDIIKHVLSKELKINNMPILSLVVMANPKTIINKHSCPTEIENSIIKYDQIKATLERYQNDKANTYNVAEKQMHEISNLLVKLNTPLKMDLVAKYQLSNNDFQKKDETLLREELTSYRLQTSRDENIKAYYIFNNNELEDMIAKYPRTEEELLSIKGFGQVKVEKYGKGILGIFNG